MPKNSKKNLKDLRGKLSKEELIKRLEDLSSTLAQHDGEDVSDVRPYVGSLVAPNILRSKETYVKLLAACCLADSLRIFVPEPPFTDAELKEIFALFVKQLRGLQKQNPLYTKYFHLLEVLANTKAFVLCLDLDGIDLVVDLFDLFFSCQSDELSTKVREYMLEVMVSIVEESDTMPDELFDMIFSKLLPSVQTSNHLAFQIASVLVKRTAGVLQNLVHASFVKLLSDSPESGLAEHAYELISQVHDIQPSVLDRVLPQLELHLKTEDKEQRLQTTSLLAKLFSKKTSRLFHTHESLWTHFVSRFRDVDADVRRECVRHAKYFLVYHAGSAAAKEVHECLKTTLMDQDDKTRAASVQAIAEAMAKDNGSVDIKLLDTALSRRLDKRPSVRRVVFEQFATIFDKTLRPFEEDNQSVPDSVEEKMGMIARHIVITYHQQSADIRLSVEKAVKNVLVSPDVEAKHRAKRLLLVFSRLDTPAVKAFEGILKCRRRNAGLLKRYAQALQKVLNTPEINITPSIRNYVAELVPGDGPTHHQLLSNWESDADNEQLELLEAMGEQSITVKAFQSKRDKLLKLIATKDAKDFFTKLFLRACPLDLDATVMQELLQELNASEQEHDAEAMDRRAKLLSVAAEFAKPAFTSTKVLRPLTSIVLGKSDELRQVGLSVLPLVGDILYKEAPRLARSLKQPLQRLAVEGTPDQAKFAVKTIKQVFEDDSEQVFQEIYDVCSENLDLDNEHYITAVRTLGYIAQFSPDVFATKYDFVVAKFVVNRLLLHNQNPASGDVESETEWNETVSDECKAKVFGIKLLVRRLLGLASKREQEKVEAGEDHDDEGQVLREDAQKLRDDAQPTIRLLKAILVNGGEIVKGSVTPPSDCARIRLVAAKAVLKLSSKHTVLRFAIDDDLYQATSGVVQDSCVEVRKAFLSKLYSHLLAKRLSFAHLAFFVLSATDPVDEIAKSSASMFENLVKTRREMIDKIDADPAKRVRLFPENALPYVIHILAFHPDFGTNAETLHIFQKYLDFFFDIICSRGSENYSYLKAILDSIRVSQDIYDEPDSPNIYILCEMALAIINNRSSRPGWKLTDFPGEVVLPSHIFVKPTDKTLNTTTRYLPEDFKLAGHRSMHAQTPRPTSKSRPRTKQSRRDNDEGHSDEEESTTPKSTKKAKKQLKSPAPPTRRNQPRSAKQKMHSMADVSDDEIERQTILDHSVIEETNNKKKKSPSTRTASSLKTERATARRVLSLSGSKDVGSNDASDDDGDLFMVDQEEAAQASPSPKHSRKSLKGKKPSPTKRAAEDEAESADEDDEQASSQIHASSSGAPSPQKQRSNKRAKKNSGKAVAKSGSTRRAQRADGTSPAKSTTTDDVATQEDLSHSTDSSQNKRTAKTKPKTAESKKSKKPLASKNRTDDSPVRIRRSTRRKVNV